METIFDHNPTPDELFFVFGKNKTEYSAEEMEYLDNATLNLHIAYLYEKRGDKTMMNKYASKLPDDMRNDFYNIIGGF